jgi:hypothetical protein
MLKEGKEILIVVFTGSLFLFRKIEIKRG